MDPTAAPESPPVPAPAPPEPPAALVASMASGWQPRPPAVRGPAPAAPFHTERRRRVSEAFAGEWIVVRTGSAKTRANDTDHRFRPGTDFAWLTGYHEPDAVLVLEPHAGGHRAVLFAYELPRRGTREYFTDTRNSELWAGPRLGLDEVELALGVATAPLGQLAATLDRAAGSTVREITPEGGDETLARALAELRVVKDDHEIACLEEAIAATVAGFEDIARELAARGGHTSERWVEGTFDRRARTEGNDVGYGTIAACGANACTLHWTRNDGPVRPGQLLLVDAGVEGRELYTADLTRTLPVGGRFSPEQREVYDAVWRAQRAAIAACRPGAAFLDPHHAAMRVLTAWLVDRGILSCTVDEALADDARPYQRYTLHGTSHMLGLDVHDCAAARDEHRRGALRPGMVLTVEPGCYLRADDLTVPERYRGIGVRIEDDVLITGDGCRVLSAALATEAGEVEAWMAAQSAAVDGVGQTAWSAVSAEP